MCKRLLLAATLGLLLQGDALRAQETKGAGVCLTPKGSIVRREKPDAKWQYVDKGESLKAGDLLLGLPHAALESPDKAVKMMFLTDFGDSPFPVIECAVILHDTKEFDLDLTLDRGRADFTNTKATGAATVRVRVQDQVFDLILKEPKTRVAVELYGRWMPGARFSVEPTANEAPAANLVILVLEGNADLKHGEQVFHMAAPPGPALIQWDNAGGLDPKPASLPKLPPWAMPDAATNATALRHKKLFPRYFELVQTKPFEGILLDFMASDDADFRRAAIVMAAAADQLALLAPLMRETKHADMWDDAIRVLRHWIGRGPGQDQKLYKGLIASKLYKPVEAETVLQLLHSFNENDRAQPSTYEMLIDYLEDERPLMRALANWHLVRLVPGGRELNYSPTADKKAREEAVKKWRLLIPPGKLPPMKGSVTLIAPLDVESGWEVCHAFAARKPMQIY